MNDNTMKTLTALLLLTLASCQSTGPSLDDLIMADAFGRATQSDAADIAQLKADVAALKAAR